MQEKGVKTCLIPGEFNQTPETADYLVKSERISSDFETVDSGIKGIAGVTAGESFFGEDNSGVEENEVDNNHGLPDKEKCLLHSLLLQNYLLKKNFHLLS